MPGRRAVWRPQMEDTAAKLQQVVQPGDVVLVKGGGDGRVGAIGQADAWTAPGLSRLAERKQK